MLNAFLIIIIGLGVFMVLERLFPARKLPKVDGWWKSVLLINLSQLGIVMMAYYLESYMPIQSRLNLKNKVSPFVGGVIAYFCHTWIFYWWHYVRHENYFLWRTLHQFHHSASRLETLTSFYKNPQEMLCNSIIMILLLVPVLGLSSESSVWLSIFSAFSEYIYHANIRTPYWMGFFIQRPESHQIHHWKNKRKGCKNFGDFPFCDMLNDTFQNSIAGTPNTGFDPKNEQKRMDMIMMRDVINPSKKIQVKKYDMLAFLILIVGVINVTGYLLYSPGLQALSLMTASSPLPLVFTTYKGIETFSFDYRVVINNSTQIDLAEFYREIDGPYARRNIYGAMFSYGPLFTDDNLIKIRNGILHWGICNKKFSNNPVILEKLGHIDRVNIIAKSKTAGMNGQTWEIAINC